MKSCDQGNRGRVQYSKKYLGNPQECNGLATRWQRAWSLLCVVFFPSPFLFCFCILVKRGEGVKEGRAMDVCQGPALFNEARCSKPPIRYNVTAFEPS